MRFVFNDVVDINKQYQNDITLGQAAGRMARCLAVGPPKDYVLHIKWAATEAVNIAVPAWQGSAIRKGANFGELIRPTLLFEHDQQFHPGLDDFTRGVYGNLPGEHDRFPQFPALIQYEILIVEFDRNRRGRNRHVPHRQSW